VRAGPNAPSARRTDLSAQGLFFIAFLAEGGGHFFLFYPRFGVAALTKVLLLGAVPIMPG